MEIIAGIAVVGFIAAVFFVIYVLAGQNQKLVSIIETIGNSLDLNTKAIQDLRAVLVHTSKIDDMILKTIQDDKKK